MHAVACRSPDHSPPQLPTVLYCAVLCCTVPAGRATVNIDRWGDLQMRSWKITLQSKRCCRRSRVRRVAATLVCALKLLGNTVVRVMWDIYPRVWLGDHQQFQTPCALQNKRTGNQELEDEKPDRHFGGNRAPLASPCPSLMCNTALCCTVQYCTVPTILKQARRDVTHRAVCNPELLGWSSKHEMRDRRD
jgi:hypothetical protein